MPGRAGQPALDSGVTEGVNGLEEKEETMVGKRVQFDDEIWGQSTRS
jgi:hypothetical protein